MGVVSISGNYLARICLTGETSTAVSMPNYSYSFFFVFFSQVTSHLSQNPSTFWHFQENTGSGCKTSPALTSESTYVKNPYSNINRGGDGSRWMQRVSVLQVLSTDTVFSIVSHQRLPWIRVNCYKRAKNAVI